MSRQIYAIDLDGTLCKEVCWTPEDCLKATPVQKMIDRVLELYSEHFILIFTALRDHLIPASLEWLRRNNIKYHAISNQKSPADVYVDDRAITFEEFLNG